MDAREPYREMRGVAASYAAELSAQFRRLNNFVTEAKGEIGRAHESYLRGVLRRFLPSKLRVGTGFIAAPGLASSQQDVLVFNHMDFSVLFDVAECLVVDFKAVVAGIEVKTALRSDAELIDAVKRVASARPKPPCDGLYAWEGLGTEGVIRAISKYLLEGEEPALDSRPTLIYIGSQCLLIRNDIGRANAPPYSIIRLDNGAFGEGDALLALVCTVWVYGIQMHVPDVDLPWWLRDWFGVIRGMASDNHWPKELTEWLARVDASRRNEKG